MNVQITRLLRIMATLRSPDNGCEWDRAQSFETIVPLTISSWDLVSAYTYGKLFFFIMMGTA